MFELYNKAVACAAQSSMNSLQVRLWYQAAKTTSLASTSGNREMPKDDLQQLVLLLSVHWQQGCCMMCNALESMQSTSRHQQPLNQTAAVMSHAYETLRMQCQSA